MGQTRTYRNCIHWTNYSFLDFRNFCYWENTLSWSNMFQEGAREETRSSIATPAYLRRGIVGWQFKSQVGKGRGPRKQWRNIHGFLVNLVKVHRVRHSWLSVWSLKGHFSLCFYSGNNAIVPIAPSELLSCGLTLRVSGTSWGKRKACTAETMSSGEMRGSKKRATGDLIVTPWGKLLVRAISSESRKRQNRKENRRFLLIPGSPLDGR